MSGHFRRRPVGILDDEGLTVPSLIVLIHPDRVCQEMGDFIEWEAEIEVSASWQNS